MSCFWQRVASADVKRVLSIVVSLIVLVMFALYAGGLWEDIRDLELASPRGLALLLAASGLNLLAHGRGMDSALTPFELQLPVSETLKISAVTRLVNQIMPGQLGVAARARYLKQQHNLEYTLFAASLAASNMLLYFVNSALGLLGLAFLPLTAELRLYALLLGAVMLAPAAIMVVPFRSEWLPFTGTIARLADRVVHGWRLVRQDHHTLMSTCAWMGITALSQALIFLAAFGVLGVPIELHEALFISGVTMLSTFMQLTPGGLGIAEGLAVASSTAVGIDPAPALVAALLRRLSGFAVSTTVALIYARHLGEWLSLARQEGDPHP